MGKKKTEFDRVTENKVVLDIFKEFFPGKKHDNEWCMAYIPVEDKFLVYHLHPVESTETYRFYRVDRDLSEHGELLNKDLENVADHPIRCWDCEAECPKGIYMHAAMKKMA